MDQFDVISVGDIVTDAFIRLIEANAHTYESDGSKWLAMPYGMKVPFDHVEVIAGVGNAPNASVSFARLGLTSGLVTNIGGDMYGHDILHSLTKNKVDTRFVRVNPGKISNYHYVLWYKDDRTILIKHEVYDYHWPHFTKKEMPKWIYFSSVGAHTEEFHDEVADWLEENPDVKLAFQPGTFQMEAGVNRLKKLYQRTEVLILNREEAVIVSGGPHNDVHKLLDKLHSFGPKIVVITDGPKGAYASDGPKRIKMPLYPDPKPPYERTGAGDAFASTFVAAIIKGADLETALKWAPINSMEVVQYVGAQAGLVSQSQLEHLLRLAPEWYKPEPF